MHGQNGYRVLRTELVLEDGTEVIQDEPTAYPQASAPSEDEVNIPIVHATSVPIEDPQPVAPIVQELPSSSAATYYHASNGPVAVVTGQPQPPSSSVAVVTGPPRPPDPPMAYSPSNRYVYRDERSGACMICGISALVCLTHNLKF